MLLISYMKRFIALILVLFVILHWGPYGVVANAGELYRWVDDNGVVHYGDSVPPEFSSKERQILNPQGIQIGTLEAERTPEQRTADARLRAEEAQRMREIQVQRQRDRVLLDTYLSVEEIELLRDRRLALLVSQAGFTEQYLHTLHSRLTGLEGRASQYNYPYKKDSELQPLPDNLAREMMETLEAVSKYEATLQTKREEQSNLVSQFDRDITRFQELKKLN